PVRMWLKLTWHFRMRECRGSRYSTPTGKPSRCNHRVPCATTMAESARHALPSSRATFPPWATRFITRFRMQPDLRPRHLSFNGGRLISMKKVIPHARKGYTQASSGVVGGGDATNSGHVFSKFHIAHPFDKNQFTTRVRMYSGLRRIDISTDLVNREEFVRYR